MLNKDKIKEILEQNLNISHLDIVDDSAKHAGHKESIKSGGGHYSIIIVSEDFKGLNPVNRHKKIYTALKEEMKTMIHALALKTLTPEEFTHSS